MSDQEMPQNLAVEEMVLSCCLLDGKDSIARCMATGTSADDFYSPKTRLLFETMRGVFSLNGSVEIAVLAEELKTAGQLESAGGYPYLSHVAGQAPTTGHLPYFLEKLTKLRKSRGVIRAARKAIEAAHEDSEHVEDAMRILDTDLYQLRHQASKRDAIRSILDFGLPDEDDSASLIGRNRYICRGDGALIVSSAGMGKSSLSVQWAVCAALCRPFMGIETKRPLTSLIVQAEDSDGDVGEVIFSVCHAMSLTPADLAIVRSRVVVKRDKVSRGAAFIDALGMYVEQAKPDLVWLNPLHAYAGCDIADAEHLGAFLREGLNKVNRHDRFAYMIIHHTPKPMTGKGVADRKWHEFMYDAAGSAELVNWARAVITLKPTDNEGDFNLILAKRGKRAGVMIEEQSEASTFLRPTTKVPIRHSKTEIAIQGRKEKFPIVSWESRDPDADNEETEASNKAARAKGQFKKTFNLDELVTYFPASSDPEGYTLTAAQRGAQDGIGIGKSWFYKVREEMTEGGLIEQLLDKTWRRTKRGDQRAKTFLEKHA